MPARRRSYFLVLLIFLAPATICLLFAGDRGAPAVVPRGVKRIAGGNELGMVPILEYHQIGRPEGPWKRTPENFRRDLEMLRALGYYPVRLQDYISGRMDVPAGRSPVVLTFDDSSEGQFRAISIDGALRPDPESAVGIMEDFARLHLDFPARATFYVLPGINEQLRLFGQAQYRSWKLSYLVKHGYELGNHTYWHQNLGKAAPGEVIKQLALAQQAVAALVPGYELASLSLPFGVWPKDRSVLAGGSYQGITYHNRAVLLVGAGPSPSPYDKGFNAMALPRIQAGDGPFGPEKTLERLARQPLKHYVSDGEPSIIAIPRELTDQLRRDLARRAVISMDFSRQAGTGRRDAN